MSASRLLAVLLAAAAVSLTGPTAQASPRKATCTGGKTIRATKIVRVSRYRDGAVIACHKPTNRRSGLGTSAPNNRIEILAIHGRRVRFVLHRIQQDAQYDLVQVIDVRTGATISADYLPYGTA